MDTAAVGVFWHLKLHNIGMDLTDFGRIWTLVNGELWAVGCASPAYSIPSSR